MRKLYVKTVYIDRNRPIASQVENYLRGQWVKINGMLARVVNVANGKAVLWMQRDNMFAVWS
jgi:hypothetical protein